MIRVDGRHGFESRQPKKGRTYMRICVFGASSTELDNSYIDAVENLGEKLAVRGHSLIFGGGTNGLMGAAARGFKKGGGKVTGVAPRFFDVPGILFGECDEFVYPDSMRDRKKYMEDNADAFIVAPGGIGTYEEFFEVLTLKQLARHAKPIALFNVNGFFDTLNALIDKNIRDGFVRPQTAELYLTSGDAEKIIGYVENDKTDINTIKFHG